jgi:transposase-like protein
VHVVGIFPNDRSLIRLAASVVIEQNEWLVGKRYLGNHTLEALLNSDIEDNTRKETRELAAV